MSSEGTIAVAAAVVALVQLAKWGGLRDSWAPLVVILLSVLGVLVWLFSGDSWPPSRTDVWPVVTGWIAVTLSAAGTFGFTRASASAVTGITSPPAGDTAPPAIPTVEAIADELERRRTERVQARIQERAASEPPAESVPVSTGPESHGWVPDPLPPIPRYP